MIVNKMNEQNIISFIYGIKNLIIQVGIEDYDLLKKTNYQPKQNSFPVFSPGGAFKQTIIV